MQPCTSEEMMLHHNLFIMDEDDDPAIPVVTATTTTTRGHRSSKATRTAPRFFGRMVARVGAGLLLLLMVEGAVVMPENEDDEGAWWSDPTAAAEAARTPRRHQRNLVAKKNPQQAPPTKYDGAVVDVGEPLCEYSDQCSCSDVVCPTRCQKNYAYCFADVNTCLNDPTSTCSDMYYKIITTCGCDTEFTCASGILRQDGIKTILVDNLSNCLFIYWDTPPPSCWESGTICVAFTTCHNCCNSWEWTPLPLTWGACL